MVGTPQKMVIFFAAMSFTTAAASKRVCSTSSAPIDEAEDHVDRKRVDVERRQHRQHALLAFAQTPSGRRVMRLRDIAHWRR